MFNQWIHRLHARWGNEAFAAPVGFAEAMVEAYGETYGTVLELGSGFTTLVLDRLLRPRSIVSLDQSPEWIVEPPHAPSVRVVLAELEEHSGWYDEEVVRAELYGRDPIGLVVCDGPYGGDRGGLMAISDLFRDDVLIIMDDCNREKERAIFRQWAADGWECEIHTSKGRGVGYARRS